MTSESGIGTRDKIQILLAEYTALRAEIVQRNTVMNQAFLVGGTAFVAIISFAFTQSLHVGGILMVLLPLLLVLAFRFARTDTLIAATRIREIETQINALAGEPLMVWENRLGTVTTGIWWRLRHVFGLRSN